MQSQAVHISGIRIPVDGCVPISIRMIGLIYWTCQVCIAWCDVVARVSHPSSMKRLMGVRQVMAIQIMHG
jgi:hypothetical protein